jgi:hypothetical protein
MLTAILDSALRDTKCMQAHESPRNSPCLYPRLPARVQKGASGIHTDICASVTDQITRKNDLLMKQNTNKLQAEW